MAMFELIATAAFGLEAVVAKELKDLGYTDQMVENGRVTFRGDETAICRANLWLRSADRVLVKMGEFDATTFEELFQGARALPWPDWLPENAEFPVDGKSVKSKLYSVSDCQAIVKKAVVEKMKEKYKTDWFAENGPRYKIEVGLLKDRATLTMDTSGAGLHKRGYRELTAKAPLRETLAAALVMLSKWPADRVLADPFCGSGTIPVEAALIGLNIAPGLRRRFAAETWPVISARCWRDARDEAKSAVITGRQLRILGTDIDEKVLSLARHHARKAGVDSHIHFQQ
ncbi:MAG: class I SAM-dependent RNA methyltransferase, partial [Bacillota bacterium]|nr:class I SAM-dependent RNA methyltransferase [Bacillota bacterium]